MQKVLFLLMVSPLLAMTPSFPKLQLGGVQDGAHAHSKALASSTDGKCVLTAGTLGVDQNGVYVLEHDGAQLWKKRFLGDVIEALVFSDSSSVVSFISRGPEPTPRSPYGLSVLRLSSEGDIDWEYQLPLKPPALLGGGWLPRLLGMAGSEQAGVVCLAFVDIIDGKVVFDWRTLDMETGNLDGFRRLDPDAVEPDLEKAVLAGIRAVPGTLLVASQWYYRKNEMREGGPTEGALYLLHGTSGKIIWSYLVDGGNNDSPATKLTFRMDNAVRSSGLLTFPSGFAVWDSQARRYTPFCFHGLVGSTLPKANQACEVCFWALQSAIERDVGLFRRGNLLLDPIEGAGGIVVESSGSRVPTQVLGAGSDALPVLYGVDGSDSIGGSLLKIWATRGPEGSTKIVSHRILERSSFTVNPRVIFGSGEKCLVVAAQSNYTDLSLLWSVDFESGQVKEIEIHGVIEGASAGPRQDPVIYGGWLSVGDVEDAAFVECSWDLSHFSAVLPRVNNFDAGGQLYVCLSDGRELFFESFSNHYLVRDEGGEFIDHDFGTKGKQIYDGMGTLVHVDCQGFVVSSGSSLLYFDNGCNLLSKVDYPPAEDGGGAPIPAKYLLDGAFVGSDGVLWACSGRDLFSYDSETASWAKR